MKRCIIHWTGGTHKANDVDRSHYHFLIEGDGKVVKGKFEPEANRSPLRAGKYAAHTLGVNTGSIGVSMCCMGGATESPFKPGKWPMTRAQWDRMIITVADLCRKYKIPVTASTVLTHAEVQANLGKPQKQKWDVTRLAFDPSRKGAKVIGDYLRAGVAAAMIPPAPRVTASPVTPVRAVPAPRPMINAPKFVSAPVEPQRRSWWASFMARLKGET